MEFGLTGLASGFDWQTFIEQVSDVERAPQRRLRAEQNALDLRKNAYASIATQLGVLKNRVESLQEATLFDARQTTSSDTTVATASATTAAALGTYAFTISQLATTSVWQGAANAGSALNATSDVSGLVLSDAAFATAVTAGTFTVNGSQVTLATDDTLQEVFDAISTATGGVVTGSYDNSTDKITLSSASEIVLGTATDTSNFLQVAKLNNNGTGMVASSAALGAIEVNAALSAGNFATAVSDGGSGAGEFKINGVSIAFSATADTAADVVARINDSTAGVTASYDSINDRFLLTNKATGDLGIALEDVTGNFLAASGLSGGALSRGNNLHYTVNGGGQLVSQSNTILEASSAIAGLSVTVASAGTTTISATSDTSKIRTAITDFVDEYNKTQSMIDAQTASTTDANGAVTAGDLAGESEANELARKLRSAVNSVVSGVSGSLTQLASLGIHSNGVDDTIVLGDATLLDEALTNNLSGIKDLFSNATDGLANELDAYLEATVGDDGSLGEKQDNLDKQIANIDLQISDLERIVLSNQERLVDSFIAMERAQSQINQQLQFLQQRFGTG